MLFDSNAFQSTFKETSLDKNSNVTLVDDTTKCYNFDGITKHISKALGIGNEPSSCDAFWKSNNGEYLIEFKNTAAKNLDGNLKKTITKKAYDSAFVLALTFCRNKTMEEICSCISLIIVYSTNKSSLIGFTKTAKGLAKRNDSLPQFGIEKMRGVLYKDVRTMDVNEFLQFIKANT